MTISVWRYSHLALAVSSFLLLTLAAVTGIILAFQPITEKIQPYNADGFNKLTLAQTLPVLRKTYPGITELSVDANRFVQVKGTDGQGKKLLAYIDPQTGKVLGIPGKKSEFFDWVTALHRSLFLHEAGRFFIGITAFLLLLITVSGTMLIIQRQGSIKRFFTVIARDNFFQYYHVVLGRWSLVPIFIIALSGTYLSMARFGLVGKAQKLPVINIDNIKSAPEKPAADFAVFRDTKLSEIESVEFPFSEFPEDYYILKLKTGQIAVNQFTGDILSEVKYPAAVMFTNLSLSLHTGRASIIWAIILAVASGNILFFIYSGFSITLKRRANRTKNKYTAADSKYIILVGSENGSTFRFANSIHQQLIKAGEQSFLTELNSYAIFPKAEHLIVLTATYGLGDAPTNAAKFAALLTKYQQTQKVSYSVLGFGSYAYPDFCRFAYEVNQLLSHQDWASALTDIHTVNDRSPAEFSLWAEAWSQQAGITINGILPETPGVKQELDTFVVTGGIAATRNDGTFSINLKAKRKLRATSGDLLAIYPANDHRERLYSIGVIDNEIRLSIRLHADGLGSGFLHRLKTGDKLRARTAINEHFHFPTGAPQVIMISNGTGIAPFLGMINQNSGKVPCHLYCGFREQASYGMYQNLLEESREAGKLDKLSIAFSREGSRQYVGDLIANDADIIAAVLKKGGVLMICGSLTMQKDVMRLLETICITKTDKGLSFYQSHNQVRTDCY
ncbi:PepSY domain-containing protein [Mucilaginibacter sp. HMF5004]|uniref:PepSY domain-containing protein n=1 Tax=Mucilaginibacter rivuli TaxID=2857527 RepID=UPI001C5D5ADA|nr:PepSY domain-containing protein [Mucilaginibacter rivuli]MBW4888762.1 PepSY domain-containing protein [Mucilaginibacter rivuli]